MIEGFKELFIRNIPTGEVLNKDTADSFPLQKCGTWMSADLNFILQLEPNGKYSLYPKRYSMKDKSVYNYWNCPEFSKLKNNTLEEITLMYNKYLK